MITRNVGHYIGDCLASIIDYIDELSIVDTRSDDDTLAVIADIVKMRQKSNPRPFRYIVKNFDELTNPDCFFFDNEKTFSAIAGATLLEPKRGINVYTRSLVMADYAKARQASYDQAQSRYKMWIDTDDIVHGAENLDGIVRKMSEEKIDSTLMTYDYDQDSAGNITNKLLRTRITDENIGAKWKSPSHETIGPLGKIDIIDEKTIRIFHRARELEGHQSHRIPLRNYKIIVWQLHRMALAKEDIPPRMWFFLGNETQGIRSRDGYQISR